MHGQGLYKWPNGRIYEGDFVNNFRHGHGEYKQPDGKKFVG